MNLTMEKSQISPADHAAGIVHIGLGAFHRAHQAVYVENTLAKFGGDWAIVSANIRSNVALVNQLNEAGNSFNVVEYASKDCATVREIKAIKEAIFTGDVSGKQQLIQRLVDTYTKVVTMTVTEKGYFLSPATGELQLDHPDLQHDLKDPSNPKTVIGLLTQSLKLRREQSLEPFTVLCCDNMPHNGQRVRKAVVDFAKALDTSLAEWIAQHVAFPSSMVDRIVPAMSETDFASIKQDTGIDSPTVVKCEQFSQWVVEDHFPQGRPQWEACGVQMVADVSAYEMMKLRMLNGSHSLLAYLGPLAGFETVADALQDDNVEAFLRYYMMSEVAPTLPSFEHQELEEYCSALIARFKNDSLQHRLSQIAMDGSQKLPQRWLQTWEELNKSEQSTAAIELGMAGWMLHVVRQFESGNSLNDPLQEALYSMLPPAQTATEVVSALLSQSDVFPMQMQSDDALKGRLEKHFMALQSSPLVSSFSSVIA